MNKEIEELKKKIEELEKASHNNIEETKEVSSNKEEESHSSLKRVLGIIFLMIFTSIMALTIYTVKDGKNNSSKYTDIEESAIAEKDDGMADIPDHERGYVVMNDYRVWWDEDMYQKKKLDKSSCFYYQPQGDFDPSPVCPATKRDIKIAKEKGTYIDDPDTVFSQNRVDPPVKKSTEKNTSGEVEIKTTVLRDDGTMSVKGTGETMHLRDGWIVEKTKGNEDKKINYFTIDFHNSTIGSVERIKTNAGVDIVSLTPFYERDFSLIIRKSDPSYNTIIETIENKVVKDIKSDKYSFIYVKIEGGNMWENNLGSQGYKMYQQTSLGKHVYFKSDKPLKLVREKVECDEYNSCDKYYILGN